MIADPDYERAPCPTCGAVTVNEAALKCRPQQTQDGENFCAGDRNDEQGFLLQMTAAAIKRLDDWVTEEARREGWIP